MANPNETWGVEVSKNGERVLTIESNFLSGEPGLEPELVRKCAHHLLAFIGDASPSETPATEQEPKPIGWVINRKRGDGIFMSAKDYDQCQAAAEADIHGLGYIPVFALPVAVADVRGEE